MEKLEDIAVELLGKYAESESNLIWERSTDYDRDYANLHEAVLMYKEKIKNASQKCKRGRWLWSFADNGWADYKCSECGFTENVDVHVSLGWRYCLNCGSYNGKEK